jgi:hypothetical protein
VLLEFWWSILSSFASQKSFYHRLFDFFGKDNQEHQEKMLRIFINKLRVSQTKINRGHNMDFGGMEKALLIGFFFLLRHISVFGSIEAGEKQNKGSKHQ